MTTHAFTGNLTYDLYVIQNTTRRPSKFNTGSQQDVYHGYLKIDIRDVYTLRHE